MFLYQKRETSSELCKHAGRFSEGTAAKWKQERNCATFCISGTFNGPPISETNSFQPYYSLQCDRNVYTVIKDYLQHQHNRPNGIKTNSSTLISTV